MLSRILLSSYVLEPSRAADSEDRLSYTISLISSRSPTSEPVATVEVKAGEGDKDKDALSGMDKSHKTALPQVLATGLTDDDVHFIQDGVYFWTRDDAAVDPPINSGGQDKNADDKGQRCGWFCRVKRWRFKVAE